MDVLSAYDGAKTGAELLTALAKLALEAKKSKNPSLHEIFVKLQGEAAKIGRRLEKDLDELETDLKNWGIDPHRSLRMADHEISRWNLLKRMAFRKYVRRLSRMGSAVKGLYADIEAVFVCAEEQESLHSGIDSAYEFRKSLSKKFADDAPISEIIGAMRDAIQSSLKVLEA